MAHIQNNLTALRWFAASLVFYGHAFYCVDVSPKPLFLGTVLLGPLGVYIFFSISGYLIARSWDSDPNAFRFFMRRALRIFPGLIGVTLLSIFVLGPALTTLSWGEYFTHSATWGYLTNIPLYLTYHLPGVFEHNIYPYAVNGSLWSLPVEFGMYMLLMLLGVMCLPRSATLVVAVVFMLAIKIWALQTPDMVVFYRTDLRQMAFCGVYFWVGAVYHRYDVHRLFSFTNVCLAVVTLLCLTRWPELFSIGMWVLLPFIVLGFGLTTGSRLGCLTNHDYSYGIYIYAFPIQQTFANLWPGMHFGLYLTTTFAVTLAFASVSWNFIEKPSLSVKPSRRTPKPVKNI